MGGWWCPSSSLSSQVPTGQCWTISKSVLEKAHHFCTKINMFLDMTTARLILQSGSLKPEENAWLQCGVLRTGKEMLCHCKLQPRGNWLYKTVTRKTRESSLISKSLWYFPHFFSKPFYPIPDSSEGKPSETRPYLLRLLLHNLPQDPLYPKKEFNSLSSLPPWLITLY